MFCPVGAGVAPQLLPGYSSSMAPNDDMLDGCGVDCNDPAKTTTDDDIAALVLFADVEFTTPEAVEARKAEWQELFG